MEEQKFKDAVIFVFSAELLQKRIKYSKTTSVFCLKTIKRYLT